MGRYSVVSSPGWLAAIGAAALLVGCSTTIPVAVIGQNGMILRGENNNSVAGGSFSVTLASSRYGSQVV
jgi:hypothetical protein